MSNRAKLYDHGNEEAVWVGVARIERNENIVELYDVNFRLMAVIVLAEGQWVSFIV